MAKTIGTNINTNTDANSDTFSIGSVTAVDIIQDNSGAPWSSIEVTSDGNKTLFVRLRPAGSDNNKDGRRVEPGQTVTVVKDGNYTGVISAIFDSGVARDVNVVYF